MITISLDEQGIFENNKNDNTIVMVAGIVFDDKGDPKEAKREKSRVRCYFEKVCNAAGGDYPSDLHISKNGKTEIVKKVKEEYKRTLGDFLKRGTYRGETITSNDHYERIGEYHVYALVKSSKGKKALSSPHLSNLIDEKRASNLYMHMVEDTLSRLLFYNNSFSREKKVSLDLATRVFVGEKEADIQDYLTVGYKKHDKYKNTVHLTSTEVYRTAIEREMLLSGYDKKTIAPLKVRSIQYGKSWINSGMEFLYMADAICSCLGFRTKYSKGNYVDSVWNKMKNLCENRLLFLYDDVDTEFVRAWNYANSGDVYNSLSSLYNATWRSTNESIFYKKIWEKELINRIAVTMDELSFSNAVNQLVSSLKTNTLEQERIKYIFDKLDVLSKGFIDDNIQNKAVLYDLYDSGISACNHVGDSNGAKKCISKCAKYNRYIGVERIIRNRHRDVVNKCDSFEFNAAKEMALQSCRYYESTYEIQKNMLSGKTNHMDTEYGIALSQLGQVYSYLREDTANEMFEKALSLIEKRSPDYYITESYYLQHLIDCGNKEKYEVIALDYYGTNDLSEQMEYIVNAGTEKKPVINLKFAVYAYLKAIYRFYSNEIPADLLKKMASFEDALKEMKPIPANSFRGHPWELSYKYLSMILHVNGNIKGSEKYERKMKNCLKNKGKTINILELFSDAEVSMLKNGKCDDKIIKKICSLITQNNREIKTVKPSFEELEKIITYTYR